MDWDSDERGALPRNLLAHTFSTSAALGSTVFGVGHVTRNKIDYCLLGDVQMMLFRESYTHGAKIIFPLQSVSSQVQKSVLPWQAFNAGPSQMSFAYVENIFQQANFGSIMEVRPEDTLMLLSRGVTNALADATMKGLVAKAYKEYWSPEQLTNEIMTECMKSAQESNQQRHITIIVAYVYQDQ